MNLNIDKNKKLWITSDTHFNHTNICSGTTKWRLPDGSIPINQTRDFETLDKMNDVIVNNINSNVGKDDVLIHLGDWSFGGFENISNFRDRLICDEIHLVLGNHDQHIKKNKNNCQSLFASVQNYLHLTYKKQTNHEFILCHYPICSWHDMKRGVFHLFGHLHSPKEQKYMGGRSMDVGMDGNDLIPYNIENVIEKLSGRPVSYNTLKSDHHLDDIKGIVG